MQRRSSAPAPRAGLPLYLGLYRPAPGLVYLDFNRDGIPDRTFGYATPPERVLAADMNGDGHVDLVNYQNGVWYTSTRRDGVIDRVDTFGGDPGNVAVLGDLDGDGIRPDRLPMSPVVREVVDAVGRRNQFGHVVRVRPEHVPGVTLTRVVDAGSGLLAQNPYPLTIPTPYPGPHRVDVRFAGANASFTMQPGTRVRVYASGSVETF